MQNVCMHILIFLHSCCYVKTMILGNKEETCQAPDAPSSTLSNFQGNLGKFSFKEMEEEKLQKSFRVIKGDPTVKGCSLHSQLMGSAPTLIRSWWDHCTYLIECSRTLIYVKTEQEQGS